MCIRDSKKKVVDWMCRNLQEEIINGQKVVTGRDGTIPPQWKVYVYNKFYHYFATQKKGNALHKIGN